MSLCLEVSRHDVLCVQTKCHQHFPAPMPGWSGGTMVLGQLRVPERPTIWMIVGQGPTALVVGAGGVFGRFYSLLSFL